MFLRNSVEFLEHDKDWVCRRYVLICSYKEPVIALEIPGVESHGASRCSRISRLRQLRCAVPHLNDGMITYPSVWLAAANNVEG
jgi:hypothetical protein